MTTRFAPSPTGLLHLGHAWSAHVVWSRGPALLRIEDIDRARVRPEFEAAIFEDLRWLGFEWPEPVMRQSRRLAHYSDAVDRLAALGLVYPCSCTRAEIRAALSAPQEGAGEVVYPGTCRGRSMSEAGPGDALRLDMAAATEGFARMFDEIGPIRPGRHVAEPGPAGDIVLSRRDIGTSYHVAVVVDDAAQGITEVVRGADLWDATPIHVLLQSLLKLPTPRYHHHRLVRYEMGKRLAKRDDARAIRAYRQEGLSPAEVISLAEAGTSSPSRTAV